MALNKSLINYSYVKWEIATPNKKNKIVSNKRKKKWVSENLKSENRPGRLPGIKNRLRGQDHDTGSKVVGLCRSRAGNRWAVA